jgi:hypothetical protein
VSLPAAHIGHQTADRIRIRIPSRKGEAAYFSAVGETLHRNLPTAGIEVNPATGSVLLKGPQMDAAAIASTGEKNGLFALETRSSGMAPLSKKIATPFRDLSRSVDRFSGGELDLPGMAFLALIGVGVYQLARGNITAPPWYSAFWYALGLFTKHIVDKA